MILTEVTARLEALGIAVRAGYPGTEAGVVTQCVAAVDLTALDESKGEGTVAVTVLSPRAQGLAACQSAAGQALAALRAEGWEWSFRSWRYDSVCDCFTVELLGRTGIVLENGAWAPMQLQVSAAGRQVKCVTAFTARRQQDRRLIRPHGQAEPVGVTPGRGGWSIELTQWLRPGERDPEDLEEPFTLEVWQGGSREIYTDCCWSEQTVRHVPGGTQLQRSGFALKREVV